MWRSGRHLETVIQRCRYGVDGYAQQTVKTEQLDQTQLAPGMIFAAIGSARARPHRCRHRSVRGNGRWRRQARTGSTRVTSPPGRRLARVLHAARPLQYYPLTRAPRFPCRRCWGCVSCSQMTSYPLRGPLFDPTPLGDTSATGSRVRDSSATRNEDQQATVSARGHQGQETAHQHKPRLPASGSVDDRAEAATGRSSY